MSSLYCGILINQDYSLEFILGLLNSNLFFFLLYKYNFENTQGVFTKAKIYHYDQLPVKQITYSNQKPIINIVDNTILLKKSNPQADTAALEAEIDKLVYDLYGLTDEEIAIVEDSVS